MLLAPVLGNRRIDSDGEIRPENLAESVTHHLDEEFFNLESVLAQAFHQESVMKRKNNTRTGW